MTSQSRQSASGMNRRAKRRPSCVSNILLDSSAVITSQYESCSFGNAPNLGAEPRRADSAKYVERRFVRRSKSSTSRDIYEGLSPIEVRLTTCAPCGRLVCSSRPSTRTRASWPNFRSGSSKNPLSERFCAAITDRRQGPSTGRGRRCCVAAADGLRKNAWGDRCATRDTESEENWS